MIKYFEFDSVAQLLTISEGLYKLMYPNGANVSTKYLFGYRVVAGKTLAEINDTVVCPVFQKPTTDTILAEIVAAFGNKIPQQDRAKYRDYMKGNSTVLLINLIPSTLTEYSQQWVDENTPGLF
jgi:hypothetical protein